jgi:phosphoribosylglycinamide formyltransferase 1
MNIAIFASGGGSNAAAIIEHFRGNGQHAIQLVVSNKPTAGVINIAESNKIAVLHVERADFQQPERLLNALKSAEIDLIVLAGFLWLIPVFLVEAYPNRILNIHPALLPAYGGKGMYGMHIHEAVKAAGEKETGISIHHVDAVYDQGALVFQGKCNVLPADTAIDIAAKVLKLEHHFYPKVIEAYLNKLDLSPKN